MNKTKIAMFLAAITLGLSGCSVLNESGAQIRSNHDAATNFIEDIKNKAKPGAVEIFAGQRLSGIEIDVSKKESLPKVFGQPFLYTTHSAPPREVIRMVSLRTGIPFVIQDEAGAAAQSQSQNLSAQGSSSVGGLMSIFSKDPVAHRPMAIEWNRSLSELLSYVAMTMGQYWKYEDGRIHFYKEETRTFTINLPQGKKEVAASISLDGIATGSGGGSIGGAPSGGGGASATASGLGGSGSSSSRSGSVSVSTSMNLDPFTAIANGVSAIIANGQSVAESSSNQGMAVVGMPGMVPPMPGSGISGGSGGSGHTSGKVVLSPELGVITVTAPPPVLDRVAEYIDNVNKKFSKNILIDVTVYNVSLSKEMMAGVGVDLNRLLMRSFGELGASITSPSLLSPISGVTPGQLLLERTSNAGSSTSSAAIVAKAMGGIGDVALLRRGQVVAINGQPSPLQVGSNITYLASSSTTQMQNAGTTTSLTPGQAVVGMTANFLPTITSDNRILLQYQLNISNLVSIEQVTSGESMIQTPNISQQSLQQQAFLRDGQSLVLFGYDQDQSTQNTGASMSSFSKNADKKRQMTVIVMQVHTGGIN